MNFYRRDFQELPVPDRYFVKEYCENYRFEGWWNNGLKVEGIFKCYNKVFYIKFDNGYPKELVFVDPYEKIDGLCVIKIDYPFKVVYRNNRHYEERSQDADSRVYYCVFYDNEIQFKGKLFNKPDINIIYKAEKDYTYIGEAEGIKPKGYGLMKWKDRQYEGDFLDQKPHGTGTMTYKDGRTFTGSFLNGSSQAISNQIALARDFPDFFNRHPFRSEEINEDPLADSMLFQLKTNLESMLMNTEFESKFIELTNKIIDLKILHNLGSNLEDYKAHCIEKHNKLCEDYLVKVRESSTIAFRDCGRYKGEVENNKCNGKGFIVFKSGDKYMGEWVNNKIHGFGTYNYRNGSWYRGEFKDNKRHGYGVFRSGDNQYSGYWKNNFQHGKGVFKTQAKNIEGEWTAGKISLITKVFDNSTQTYYLLKTNNLI